MRLLGRNIGLRSLVAWSVGAVAVALLVLSSLGVFSSVARPKATVVSSLATSNYGPVLVVGGSTNGGLYHFPLYEFSGDVGSHLGCGTTKTVAYDLGAKESIALTCTGPEGDLLADISSDDWPALTTKAAPVAGPGVNAKLLGSINRPGIGRQITYDGHPLYLFDPSSQPFVPQGESFMETVKPLPPWRGYWFLASAATGAPAPGVATLRVEQLANGKRALAAEEDTNVAPIKVTLYSGPIGDDVTTCAGACALLWTPLLTRAPAAVASGVNGSLVGEVRLSDGNYQVTYDHHPLFLYDQEEIVVNRHHRLANQGSLGNGAGQRGPGGVMTTIALNK